MKNANQNNFRIGRVGSAVVVIALGSLPLSGIAKDKEPSPAEKAAESTTAAPAKVEEAKKTPLKVGNFTFQLSPPWTDKKQTRPMVKAVVAWTDPAKTHKPLDATFYHFGPGQGGSVGANVSRWEGQFRGKVDKNAEELNLKNGKVTIVHLKGTYMDGPMFGDKTPKDGHAMLGAIFEDAKGGHVFIKLTGPGAAVEASKKAFYKLASSPLE